MYDDFLKKILYLFEYILVKIGQNGDHFQPLTWLLVVLAWCLLKRSLSLNFRYYKPTVFKPNSSDISSCKFTQFFKCGTKMH